MDIYKFINKIYGTLPQHIQEPARGFVEIVGGAAPYISSVLNYLRFNSINKELHDLQKHVDAISEKVDTSIHAVYLKQEVFPIILNRILNDEQSEKIKIVLNGFEYIIDNNILDLDKIFNYYDVLAEMRVSEIVYFTESYVEPMEYLKHPDKVKLNMNLKMEYTDEDREREDIERYMDNKLFRLGILEYVKERVDDSYVRDYSQTDSMPYKWQKPTPERYETNTDRYQISPFGKRFINFFYDKDTEE